MRAPARRGRRFPALTALLLAAVVGASIACDDIPTNPSQVFALHVDSTPSPSVVAGDTLRDTNGVVTPLIGQAYNVSQQLLTDVPVQFLSLNPDQLTITSANIAIGNPAGDSIARVLAQAQSLQSLPFTLPVVLRPDSIIYSVQDIEDSVVDSVDTVQLSLSPDSNCSASATGTLTCVSPGLDITLWHDQDSLGADSVTRTYIVHYQIIYPAAAAKGTGTPTDTSLFAYLTDPNGNPSRTDTTDANGSTNTSMRTITIRVDSVSFTANDSIVAVATAVYRQTPVANSPLRFVVHYLGPGVTSGAAAVRGSALPSCARGPCHDRH